MSRARTRVHSPPGPAVQGAAFLAATPALRRSLERMIRDRARITRAFRGLLRRLEPGRETHATRFSTELFRGYRLLLGSSGDAAYALAVEKAASTLLRAGVPQDHAIAAVGLHLEASLAQNDTPGETKALVRLTSATQGLVAATYAEDQVSGLTRLDDRERQKLSGDLHDEVGSDLIVLKLYVEMIASEIARGSATPVGPKLEEALALIAHAIDSVRRLTLDLGPAFLDSLGFRAALRNFVRQFSQRTAIKVRLKEPRASVTLPSSHEVALYRLARGALSNVAKHSKARNATVSLRIAGGAFVMAVEDDGKGFDVRGQNPEQSFGLNAMRERVRTLGGRLSIRSRVAHGSRGSGTRLEVRLPLKAGARS
jgi:signal transduction histidine kinase